MDCSAAKWWLKQNQTDANEQKSGNNKRDNDSSGSVGNGADGTVGTLCQSELGVGVKRLEHRKGNEDQYSAKCS